MAATIRKKIVIVGDGACGKTCLLFVFSKKQFPEEYVPTVFENYVADIEVDNRKVELALWDTAGQEDYDRLRPLSYPDTDVVLMCFSMDSPDSLDNITDKWVPEMDVREDEKVSAELAKTNQKVITPEQGRQVADVIKAHDYIECSAKQNINVEKVFIEATRCALARPKISQKKKCLLL
ncbi:rho-related GTP-binding protein RhoA-C-like isoform X2 [Zophobas morio]|uniref:rho-related GTP-binding protein RhoA-C-like isoform X2 n=1 Tax=Zophobas morio TaxID=2755281 RepID=UPI00308336A3